MNSFVPGAPIRLIGTFQNVSGALADPTSIYLHILPPAQFGAIVPGTVEYTYASGSIIKATTGSYYFDLNPIPYGTYGVWTYAYNGTGALISAFVDQFFVQQITRG